MFQRKILYYGKLNFYSEHLYKMYQQKKLRLTLQQVSYAKLLQEYVR
jgi:hypothetical protein